MTFFLDVFNHVLKMDDKEVFIVYDNKGNCWFAFRELLGRILTAEFFITTNYIILP